MNCSRTIQIVLAASVLAVALATAGAGGQAPGSAPARIEVTDVPPPDCGGPAKQATIAGKITGRLGTDDRVVIYAAACNGVLYVQPTAAAPFTTISDGDFNAFIHLGHTYYVLLVKSSFKLKKPEIGEAEVPRVGGDVIAIAKVPGKK